MATERKQGGIGGLLLLFFVAFWVPGWCQVKFYSLVSENQISFAQTFQVQYVIEGAKSVKEFTVPGFNDFQLEEVIDLPPTPALDPKTLKLVEQHSKIVILTPIRVGRFQIPGATAIVDGRRMKSNTVKVNVKAPAINRVSPESSEKGSLVENASELKPGERIEEKIQQNFFVRAEVSKPVCYVGEPIMAIYKAYSRLNANSRVVRRPAFTGFSVIEMVDGYDAQPTVERFNGKYYYVHLVRKVQLFPLQEGNYELDAAEIEGTIHFTKQNQSNVSSPFEAFDHNVVVVTKPVQVKVVPIPETGQPLNFTGAVGQFTMTVNTGALKVKADDVIKIQVVISGGGNLPLLNAPIIKWPDELEVSDPVVKEDINKYAFPLHGSKIFEYSFVPKKTGEWIIPKILFSYYDPLGNKYNTLEHDSILVTVLATNNTRSLVLPDQGTVKSFPRERTWYIIVAGIIVTVIIIQLAKRSGTKRQSFSGEMGNSKKVVFNKARQLITADHDHLFFTELERILWQMAAEKCNLSPSALNLQNISSRLRELGIPADTSRNYCLLIQECESALYAAALEVNDKYEMLERAEQLVNELDNP